jgi:hypothetical protein
VPKRSSCSLNKNQRGAAALIFLIILALAGVYLLAGALQSSNPRIERDKITAAALAQAKAALIGRAATDGNRPGSMPCPDTNNDGSAELFAGVNCPTYIGRLPWRTLGLPDLRDGWGEHLWYALSSNLRDNAAAEPINSNTQGLLTVTGSVPVPNVVAIVVSAGPVLGTQTRETAQKNTVANYLEGENANGDNTFSSGPESLTFNDRILTITHDEFFSVVERRVAAEIRGQVSSLPSGLRGYYDTNHVYPGAGDASGAQIAPYAPSGAVPYNDLSFLPATKNWLINNGWFGLATYAVAPNFQQGTVYPQQCGAGGAGCLSVNGYPFAQAAVTMGTQSVIVCATNPVVTSCP